MGRRSCLAEETVAAAMGCQRTVTGRVAGEIVEKYCARPYCVVYNVFCISGGGGGGGQATLPSVSRTA